MTVCPFPAFCYVSLLSHESPLSLLLLCFCHIFFTSLVRRPLLHTVDLRYLNSSTSTTCTPCSCHTVVFSFTHMYSALLLHPSSLQSIPQHTRLSSVCSLLSLRIVMSSIIVCRHSRLISSVSHCKELELIADVIPSLP